jgi:hypothetical protein
MNLSVHLRMTGYGEIGAELHLNGRKWLDFVKLGVELHLVGKVWLDMARFGESRCRIAPK